MHLDEAGDLHAVKGQVIKGNPREVAWGLSLVDSEWSTDNYVLIPGAVYGGNRFHAKPYAYAPPVVGPDPEGTDRTPWIGDLPRLQLEAGPSHLDQLSIDAATPGMAVYFPHRRKALFLLTKQAGDYGPFGLEVLESDDRTEAELLILMPGMRHDKYFKISGGYVEPSADRAADLQEGDFVEMAFRLLYLDCHSVEELFFLLFEHRYDCFGREELRNEISFSATWDILHAKHNRENWREEEGVYQVSINHDPPNPFMLFQTGWVGGMITPLPMIQEGAESSLRRCIRNIDTFVAGQTDFGLFHEYYHGGRWFSKLKIGYDEAGNGIYQYDTNEQWTLGRRIGDVLYFFARTLSLLKESGQGALIKTGWEHALRRNAQAVLRVWKNNGELGQYVDVETGRVQVAGSTACALVPAGLLAAGKYFETTEFLATAEAIAEKYRCEDLRSGVTTGGPGDCVQAPDSESVAALVESFVLLWEETGHAKWLKAAESAAMQLASWALSYDYVFPEDSALARIKAQSRGVFIANAQNTTGVPGICTLSGQGLLRVFRATGKPAYLDLLKEIAHCIGQYMGRSDKAIPTRLKWGRPGVRTLPEGWICERVNVTQWGEELGEIAAYSCWCEVAMMLTWCELPGIYCQPDSGILCMLDHVEASLKEDRDGGKVLEVFNPTNYPARVKLLIEDSTSAARPLDLNFGARLREVACPAGETRRLPVGHPH